jgi:hypothetical protein
MHKLTYTAVKWCTTVEVMVLLLSSLTDKRIGGALFLFSSCLAYLYDSVLQNNDAHDGAGMYCADSKVYFYNATLAKNSKDPQDEIYCSYFPSLTYCRIDGDSKWTEFCKAPVVDNESAYGVEYYVTEIT